MNALLGKKLGMTRVFAADGRQVPVTAIAAGPCVVVQRKTVEKDGYSAVQIGFAERRAAGLSKPEAGRFAKAGIASPLRHLAEVRIPAEESAEAGATFTVDIFKDCGFVDVTGVTKGRGFQGVMKRHGMAGQPAAHGHTMHRRPGSVGMREEPGRLLKNKRLPGHMGHVTVTTQNLRVVSVRSEDHVLLVEGSVPGPVGGLVQVRKAIKKAAGVS